MTPLVASRTTSVGRLEVREPSARELDDASTDLAAFYNVPENAAILRNTIHFAPPDVTQLWREIAAEPGRATLLFRDGVLVGDAAFRQVRDRSAELGLLIGPRALHGLGLGGHFTRALLGLAFGPMGLARVHVAIRADNTRSLRLFAGAGFVRDDSAAARARAESDDEVTMTLEATAFAPPC